MNVSAKKKIKPGKENGMLTKVRETKTIVIASLINGSASRDLRSICTRRILNVTETNSSGRADVPGPKWMGKG